MSFGQRYEHLSQDEGGSDGTVQTSGGSLAWRCRALGCVKQVIFGTTG